MSRAFAASVVLFGSLLLVSVGPGSREQARLRAHFDSVLVELRGRDVSGLSTAQMATRQQLIEWLSDYSAAGRFPLNDRYANEPTPIFRDARGTLCAMAFLIARSGHADLVDRIAGARNLAYIGDLTNEPSLVEWLDHSGLSEAEAARIQPAYERENDLGTRVGLAVGTVVLSGASLAMAASNAFRPGEGMGFVGMAIGTVTVTLGAATSTIDDYRPFAAANIVSGGLAIVTGFYAAFRPRPAPPPSRELAVKRRAEWAPLADIDPTSGRIRAGFAARF